MSKEPSFSDQLRRAVIDSGMSRYKIAKEIEMDQAALSRFMAGKSGLGLGTIDRLCDLLDLDVVAKPKRKKRTE